jgi:hypothetical protein
VREHLDRGKGKGPESHEVEIPESRGHENRVDSITARKKGQGDGVTGLSPRSRRERSGRWMSGGTTRGKGREETPRLAVLREARRRRVKFFHGPLNPIQAPAEKFSGPGPVRKNLGRSSGAGRILYSGGPIAPCAGRLTGKRGELILRRWGWRPMVFPIHFHMSEFCWLQTEPFIFVATVAE